MPVQHGIDIAKQPFADHVDFARAALLRRCSVQTNGAPSAATRQPFFHCNGSRGGTRAEQIVTACVTCRLGGERLPTRTGALREARRGVVSSRDRETGWPRPV